jgi:ABC-2 type transport system ATP-binding protein
LVRADAGQMRLLGEEAWELGAAGKARLGYVPQVIALYPWMRVRQLMDYTAPFYPRWNGGLVTDLLRRFEVDALAKVKTLSVGTLQKLATLAWSSAWSSHTRRQH